jgi:GDPmannose 4,6-dehydratase
MKAFLTGVTGQAGHYLSKFLLAKNYEVYRLVRRTSKPSCVPEGVKIVEGDVTDPSVTRKIWDIDPDEIYHLAAMSHVGESFKIPYATFQINACGTLNLLEGARRTGSKFYQASTSELFGSTPPPQNELTLFHPRSPYGVSKLAAYWLTVNYREAYGIYAVNGILFNHESPLRGHDFVTQKVARYCAALKPWLAHFDHDGERERWAKNTTRKLKLGNLDAKRDWGHAADFVEGMWLMMQQPSPSDYVLATGVSRSIRDLLDVAFKHIGISDWSPYVEVDQNLFRPSDVDSLCGDASKAKSIGWEPKITFESMIGEMIDSASD